MGRSNVNLGKMKPFYEEITWDIWLFRYFLLSLHQIGAIEGCTRNVSIAIMSKKAKVNYPLFSIITGSASWCGGAWRFTASRHLSCLYVNNKSNYKLLNL